MINPHTLSEDALAVLRCFAREKLRDEGERLGIESVRETWRRPTGDLATAIDELVRRELLTVDDAAEAVVLTATARALFDRYLWTCH